MKSGKYPDVHSCTGFSEAPPSEQLRLSQALPPLSRPKPNIPIAILTIRSVAAVVAAAVAGAPASPIAILTIRSAAAVVAVVGAIIAAAPIAIPMIRSAAAAAGATRRGLGRRRGLPPAPSSYQPRFRGAVKKP